MNQSNQTLAVACADGGPLLEEWTGPLGVPPFERVRPEHFLPAFTAAFAERAAEVAAVASDPAQPSFANTIEAMERAGETGQPHLQCVPCAYRSADQ